MSQRRKKPRARRVLAFFLEAAMILLAAVFIYPALFVLINAFKPDAQILLSPLSLPKGLYLGNFAVAWKTIDIPLTFLRTLLVTSGSVLGILLVSSMAAYMLARTETRLSRALYLFFAFALVIPFQVIMVPIAVLASDLGLTNMWGIVAMYWGLGCPMAVFMYHGFVKGVPRELEESAAMDGAGRFYVFFAIVLPLLKPITATIAVLDALWVWNDFLLPLIIVRKGTIQLEQMVFNGQFVKQYGPISASLVLSALPIVVFYLALQKHIVKGIAAGAVKG